MLAGDCGGDESTDGSRVDPGTSPPPVTGLTSDPVSKSYPPLAPFSLFGWRPNPSLSDDENCMDIVLLITRHSVCDWQGHMGSIIVNPAQSPKVIHSQRKSSEIEVGLDGVCDEEEARIRRLEHRLFSRIIGAATNSPLYRKQDSDLHAEIDALGQACRSRLSTDGCTVYITMPPCRKCFAALVSFRVGRIVSRKLPPEKIRAVASERGIEVVELTVTQRRTQMARINALVNSRRTDEDLMRIATERKRRKDERKRRGG